MLGGPDSRDANHLSLSHKSADLDSSATLYHQKFAATHGGPAMFIDMPLHICAPDIERLDALRLERWFYNQFGTHNSKPGRLRAGTRNPNDNKRDKRNKIPRRRPVMSMRSPGPRAHNVNNTNVMRAPQIYTITGERSSSDFAVMIKHAHRSNCGAVVEVCASAIAELSNKSLLRRRYGNSVVLLTFKDDF
eukprot:SAG11_NODE_4319_length_1950_cov_1.651540_2_plen_191_part_00